MGDAYEAARGSNLFSTAPLVLPPGLRVRFPK
jgi:hypothetical protein